MNHLFTKTIETARNYLLQCNDPAHDLAHALEVVKTSIKICQDIGYSNPDLIVVAAWWHDVGRLFNPVHEYISAKMARDNLIEIGCNPKDANLVFEAIRLHKWDMEPACLEGNIIRDADKLQFISVRRWNNCINVNEYMHIKPIVPLLPKLRGLLKLNASKLIYDDMVVVFIDYIRKIKTSDKELQKIVYEINRLNLISSNK
jgi:hypothetical protein